MDFGDADGYGHQLSLLGYLDRYNVRTCCQHAGHHGFVVRSVRDFDHDFLRVANDVGLNEDEIFPLKKGIT